MRQVRSCYRLQASELVLAYALLARSKGLPAPAIAGFDLTGARLKGWRFEGEEGNRLNMRGAVLRNADLVEAWFEQVDLSDVDLSGADLTRAELHQVRAVRACLRLAQLPGTIFRNADLEEADLEATGLQRTQILHSSLQGTRNLDTSDPGLLLACNEPPIQQLVTGEENHLAALTGNSAGIKTCAYSPDGRRVVTAGDNGRITLWDVSSGDQLLQISVHWSEISACAFSPDGRRIATAGDDQTKCLWDAESGEQLLTCSGHQDIIWACAFSPDGRCIATASDDQTMRIWDLDQGCETGFRVHILPDGEYAVFTPDGQGLIQVSPGAWRWLGWLGKDPETGKVTRYPAEIFGPLPVKGEKP